MMILDDLQEIIDTSEFPNSFPDDMNIGTGVDDDGFDYYTEDEANALFSPIDHEHGNITNDGKIGTTANKPLKTTTGGSVSTGDWESNTNNIKMNGAASVGVSNNFVRADHVHPSDTTKVDTAGTGLSKIGTTLNHSNSVTAQTTTALKKISYDTEGHITGSANVTASDLPSNIPTSKISGLSTVATSGKYTDLNDLPSDYEYIEKDGLVEMEVHPIKKLLIKSLSYVTRWFEYLL